MKRLTALILVCLLTLSLCACGGGDEKETTAATKTDWRNTIEYEGSFYVNSKVKVLYALDKGSVTIWDNAGNGNVLQTINYNTSVSDAIERIEKKDFNADGSCDLRIIYSENESGTRYNLFLWSENTKRFAECRLYNEITDPVIDESTGEVIGVYDNGIFGVLTCRYAFNENCGLDLIESSVGDMTEVAKNIAKSILGDTVTVTLAEGQATVEGEVNHTFIVKNGGADIAYLACSSEGIWAIDKGCYGFYRLLSEKDGAVLLGNYLGEGRAAQSLAVTILGADVEIHSLTAGTINESTAKCYVMMSEGGETISLAGDSRGFWYISRNGVSFTQVNASTGVAINDTEYEFAVSDDN